jgi:hypothetical protein
MTSPQMDQPTRGSVSVDVAASPEDVYALVSDITRMGEWSPECTGGRWLGGASGPAVGVRFVGTNKARFAWSTTSRVVAAEPGRRFAFERDRPPGFGAVRWSYDIEPIDGGTRVVESFEVLRKPPGLMRALARLWTGVSFDERLAHNENTMRVTLERLKEAVDGGAG